MPVTLNPAANTKRASTNANTSPATGGLVVQLAPSNPVIGTPVVATLSDSKTGTFQFFRVSGLGVKSNVGAASAADVTSHSYTPGNGDLGYTIGCDVTTVTNGLTVSAVNPAPATAPGQPVAPVLTALTSAVSVAWTAPADGGSGITRTEYTSIDGLVVELVSNPQVVAAPPGVPTTGTVRSQNAIGWGPASPQAAQITPLSPPQRLAITNWRGATTAEAMPNTNASLGRNVHSFGQPVRNLRMVLPTFANGNGGDFPAGAFVGNFAVEFRGQAFPVLFNGQTSRSVLADERGVTSDVIDWTQFGLASNQWPANEEVFVRYDVLRADSTVLFTAGHIMAQDSRNSCTSYNSSNVTSKSPVVGTGAMTVTAPANVSIRPQGYNPMLVGEPVDALSFKSIVLFGASMEDGGTDLALPTTGRGFLRALFGTAGKIAGGTLALAGNSTTAFSGTHIRSFEYFKYFTHMEESIGGNDIGSLNGTSLRQKYYDIQKFRKALWAIARAASPGIKIAGYEKPPAITASSDFFATLGGQTVGTEWGMFNGTNPESTDGLGDRYRQWQIEQVHGTAPAVFNASINNVLMTVSGLVLPGRRIAVGDTLAATGYTGTVMGVNTSAADGSGTYTISPAVPTGLTIRAFTATVANGIDYSFGHDKVTAPGRRDLWAVASTTGIGLPGDAPLGRPAPQDTGGNHPATNHYIVLARQLRTEFLGMND